MNYNINSEKNTPEIILASSSPFRKELLQRLQLPFETISPDIDEKNSHGESPQALVARLALAKANAIAEHYIDALIIGSDQVAVLDDQILGKPGSHERAHQQLRAASGKRVLFLTGLCLLDSRDGTHQDVVVPFEVEFRQLNQTMIEAYLKKEQPYHCAGSFKSEGLGITLFERLGGDDPTALIGLPLIQLTRMLERAGVSVL